MPKVDAIFEFDAAAAIEAAAESILITTAELDAPGPSIVYVNPAFERITGWSRAEVVGQSPRILQGPKTDHRIFADLEEENLKMIHEMQEKEQQLEKMRSDEIKMHANLDAKHTLHL